MAKVKQAVKHTGRGRKEQIVAELIEKFDTSNGLVFVDFQGITHQQLESLKKELKTVDSTIVVAKNSLVKISLGQSKNYADFKDNEGLNLPTATLIIKGDMVEPLKKLQKAVKDMGLPKVKFAILEGNLTDESGVMKIAALPSRETLIAQFVGTLNSPIQGLVVTLNATISKFVMTLDAVAKSKPAEPAAPAAGTTETSTEAIPAEENKTEEAEAPIETAELEETSPSDETSEDKPAAETNETDEKNEGGEN